MSDLTSTLASLQHLAEPFAVKAEWPGHLEESATISVGELAALASAVLALVEVARAADVAAPHVSDETRSGTAAGKKLNAALTRLSALSPKEGE